MRIHKIIIQLLLICSIQLKFANLRNLQIDNCPLRDDNGTCVECSYQVLLPDGRTQCVVYGVGPCKTADKNEKCTSCPDGYLLDEGTCGLVNGNSDIDDPSGP